MGPNPSGDGGHPPVSLHDPRSSSTDPSPPIPLPDSMAAIGDSITQGVGGDPTGYAVAPEYSWATGGAEGMASHYARIRSLNARIESARHNLAIGGAGISSGPRQARRAVALGADYVTFLLGGNDLCTWSKMSITSVSSFERHFCRAIEILTEGLPRAHIYVSSIPNVHRLWEILHQDPAAQTVWRYSRGCRSLLGPRATQADRRAVLERNLALNAVLEKVTAEQERVRFDDHALFEHAYTPAYVSLDYFHPSHVGQQELAQISWNRSFWSHL